MKASELIKLLQDGIKELGCDPYVVIQHPDDENWNERDVWRGKRGLILGYIGDKPTITLEHSDTLLGKEIDN